MLPVELVKRPPPPQADAAIAHGEKVEFALPQQRQHQCGATFAQALGAQQLVHRLHCPARQRQQGHLAPLVAGALGKGVQGCLHGGGAHPIAVRKAAHAVRHHCQQPVGGQQRLVRHSEAVLLALPGPLLVELADLVARHRARLPGRGGPAAGAPAHQQKGDDRRHRQCQRHEHRQRRRPHRQAEGGQQAGVRVEYQPLSHRSFLRRPS